MQRKLLFTLIYTALIVFALVTLVPFAYLFCASVKPKEIFFESTFLPGGPGFLGIAWWQLTLNHFQRLFTDPEINLGRNMLNSFFLASVTSTLATLTAAMGGYGLAKYRFPLRGVITGVVLAALVIPGALLIAPSYQLIFHLGLLNKFPGLILPAIAPAFGVFLFRQSMLNAVPNELIEAARLDGSGEIRTFFTIALPLVRPMIGAFLLITFLGTWNNFIGPQIIMQSPESQPLAVAITQLKSVYGVDYGLLMAGTVVSILPMLALFLMLQKEFIAGLTSGAVKG
jgi:multiple sugar transport system permease protein